MSARRYTALLCLLATQRLIELLYSERNERKVAACQPDAPHAARSTFKWIAAVNLALFTVPALERWWRGRPAPRAVARLGWLLTISAIALRLSVIATLREAWNVRAVVPGDLNVVDRGPYRLIRHPNYVALGLEFAGVPLIGGAYGSAITLSAANAALLARRVVEEEALLMAIPGYRERMASKPRFIPRLVSSR